MKGRFAARCIGDRCVLELRDSKAKGGPVASLELDRDGAFAALLSVAQALNALPLSDRDIPLVGQKAFFRSTDPSFQVGLTSTGKVILALKPEPLPMIEFEFDAETVAKLIAALIKASTLPGGGSAH